MRSLLSIPPFPVDQRPRPEEVDSYAAAIVRHEKRPPQAWERCRQEAELQLWAVRYFERGPTESDSRARSSGVSLE
jgi:hypothetical protein